MLFGCGDVTDNATTTDKQNSDANSTTSANSDKNEESTDDKYVSLMLNTRTSTKSASNDEFTYLIKTNYNSSDQGHVIIKDYHGNGGAVTIPETLDGYPVVVLYNSAFAGRSDVTDISFPSTLREISFDDFSGGKNEQLLKDTGWFKSLPDGFYYANKVAIGYKGAIPADTTFEIREGTVAVADSAFQFDGSENITNIILPDSIRYLSTYALSGTSIKEVTVKKEWQEYKDSFTHCHKLKKVIFEEGITKTLGGFKQCYKLSEIVLPSTLETIGKCSFMDNPCLKSITMPDNLRYIEDRAFEGCSLTQVQLNRGLYSIGEAAFSDCTELTELYVPRSVKDLGQHPYGFKGIENDKKIDGFTLYVEADSLALQRAQADGLNYQLAQS